LKENKKQNLQDPDNGLRRGGMFEIIVVGNTEKQG
jgi:hypothetical protein